MVAHDGKIYVFGGGHSIESAEGWSDEVCQTAEVYDPVKDEWESIPPMFTARQFAGAASLGGKIFVFGGVGDYESFQSGECYDPKTKMWNRISNMIDVYASLQYEAGVDPVAIDGSIFVADYGSDALERYSTTSNTWEKVNIAAEDSEEYFEIWKICALSEKHLPKTFVNKLNMNNNK